MIRRRRLSAAIRVCSHQSLGGHAVVAQLAAAALGADEPGDGALDHGPVLPVGGAEVGSLSPVAAALAQERVVGMHVEGAAGLSRVQRCRSGQPRQARPKVTIRVRLIGLVTPFGQVAVPAASSTVKSSRVNPPGMARRSGAGLITAVCPAASSAASASPLP